MHSYVEYWRLRFSKASFTDVCTLVKSASQTTSPQDGTSKLWLCQVWEVFHISSCNMIPFGECIYTVHIQPSFCLTMIHNPFKWYNMDIHILLFSLRFSKKGSLGITGLVIPGRGCHWHGLHCPWPWCPFERDCPKFSLFFRSYREFCFRGAPPQRL